MSHLRKIRAVLFVIPIIVTSFAVASVSINGAGSTFIYPMFTKWAQVYGNVDWAAHFTYESFGSLQGVDRMLSHTTDFAASGSILPAPTGH